MDHQQQQHPVRTRKILLECIYMDIRPRLCLVYAIVSLFSCSDLQSAVERGEVDDSAADSMHNYTNLKIFLWSGSGDGSNDGPTTAADAAAEGGTATIPFYSAENPEDCIGGHDCNIRPTSVAPANPGVIDTPQTAAEIPDKTYWIVTELDSPSPSDRLSVPVVTEKLAVLYTIAFTRRQSSRLHVGPDANRTGANGIFSKPDAAAAASSKVDVHVLSVLNGLDLVYFVTVNDRPVLAAAAVRDMSLVTTREAANHLGRAVKTKARPYLVDALHSPHAVSHNVRDVWMSAVVGTAIVLLVVLVVLVTAVAIAREKKRKKNGVSSVADNDDMAFRQRRTTAADANNREAHGTEVCGASTADADNDDDDDDDVIRTPEPKPRNRNKTSSSLLTMQAVNTFQKSSIPGPLTDVLDESNANETKDMRPLSRHESVGGAHDPGVVGPIVWDLHCKRMRIKSAAAGDDGADDNDSCTSFDAFNAADANVTKMRQKFHRLLDDAFTLFGSRDSSLHSDKISGPSSPAHSNDDEQRSKSAPFRSSATSGGRPSARPKTSADSGGGDDDLAAASATAVSSCWALSPGEAWAGSDQSMFVLPRPLSAGPFHRPNPRAEFVSSDASLSPRDPAVPLIKAIRKELDKFPAAHTAAAAAADSSR